jgi:asparagine N-glycosylation enzyme membrane subunit Stt3
MHAADSSNKKARAALGLALVLALVVRLLPWSQVFTSDGVLLMADGDTYYHALRAERIARAWPHVPWTDPGMNYPLGAAIPWPPLLDQIIATIAVVTGAPTPDHVAGVAALIPPIAGTLLVAASALLAALLLGGTTWWDAALLVALLPAAVRQSFVGRPDHHVLEALLSAAAYVIYLAGLRSRRRRVVPTLGLGVALALTFWNWSGSALYLIVLAAHAATLHLVAPAGDPAPGRAAGLLAGGAAFAALLLGITIALWGVPGALGSGSLTPITGLSVAVCAATGLGATVLWAARRWAPASRVAGRGAALLAAAAAPALLLLVLPSGLRRGLEHGLVALGASSAWYESIGEFWPLLGSGRQPLSFELQIAAIAYGFLPLLLPFAVWLLVRAWRASPERRGELAFLATWAAITLGIAVLRRRFEGYAAVPLAICAAWVVREGAAWARGRWAAAPRWLDLVRPVALVLLVLPGIPVVASGAVAELPAQASDRFPMLRWLRTVPALPGREGVLASWSDGHEIQWIARKPVVATPFGTDIDPSSIADEAAFRLESNPAAAEELLRRRRIGFVIVENPARAVATLRAFAPDKPERAIEEKSSEFGSRYAIHPEFFDLVGSRLYFFDGGSRDGMASGLGGFRLLAESQTPNLVLGYRAQANKLFGVVPGATLVVRGVAPGAEVVAVVPLRSNVGRDFAWAAREPADASGTARIRVPYATGLNGTVMAGDYTVRVGGKVRAEVPVSEAQVTHGEAREVVLPGANPASR